MAFIIAQASPNRKHLEFCNELLASTGIDLSQPYYVVYGERTRVAWLW